MANQESNEDSAASINAALTDDVLHVVLAKLKSQEEKDTFGLICQRWLRIQSSERLCLRARAGPAMLRWMADRISGLIELKLSQFTSRSFFSGVTDSDVSVIATGFPFLHILNLSNCKGISDARMIVLGGGLAYLQSFDVSECQKPTNKGLVAIARGCHNLRRLQLVGCKSMTNELLQAISKNCLHLEELGLACCFNITNYGIMNLVDGCHQIKSLDVSKCGKIGDAGISRIAEVCSVSLKVLKLLDCCNIGDKSIFSLAKSWCNLETLLIGGCRYVSDESVRSLTLSCCQSLCILRMNWCSNITDTTLSCIFSNCRYLTALDIRLCDKTTDSDFEGLASGGFTSDLKVLMVTAAPSPQTENLASSSNEKPKLQRWLHESREQYNKIVIALSLVVSLIGLVLFKWPFIGTSCLIYHALGLMVAASPCALSVAPLAYAIAISSCARYPDN